MKTVFIALRENLWEITITKKDFSKVTGTTFFKSLSVWILFLE